jgi:hypothetical protein
MTEKKTTTRHFAMWQKRDQVVLIGYSKKNNDVLVVKLDQLPEDERNELQQIALHPDIQRKYELTPTLTTARHSKSGETWMTNIAARLRRHDGSVAKAFIKDLYEVEDSQMSYYKGYGPPDAPGQLRISESEKAAVLGDDYRQRELRDTGTRSASVTPADQAPVYRDAPVAESAPAQSNELASVLRDMTAMMGKVVDRLESVEAKVKAPASRRNKPKPSPAKVEAPRLVLNETGEE